MNKRIVFVLVVCFVICSVGRGDHYGTVDVEWISLIRGMDLQIASSASFGAVETVEGVGLQQLRFTNPNLGGPDDIPADSYFLLGSTQAFCIDLWDNKPDTFPAPEYNVRSLDEAPDWASAPIGGMGSLKAGLIAELLTFNPYNTPTQAAAVQVAMWEILDENHFLFGGSNSWDVSVGEGNFFLDTSVGHTDEIAVADLANTMLGDLSTTGLSYDRYTAVSNGPGTKNWQDFVVVPVPGAVLLCMLGLGAAGVKLRKFA